MTKIVASDYKGKWFVLQDAEHGGEVSERPEINIEYVMGDGLQDHVENCRYYGIPAYVGKDEKLNARIKAIEDELDKKENT